jgi:hypothetical protein
MPCHLRAVAAHAFLRAQGSSVPGPSEEGAGPGPQNTDGAPVGSAAAGCGAGAAAGRSAKASAKPAVEGRNVTVEHHWLEGQYDRLPSLMADLVRRRVAVIVGPQ